MNGWNVFGATFCVLMCLVTWRRREDGWFAFYAFFLAANVAWLVAS